MKNKLKSTDYKPDEQGMCLVPHEMQNAKCQLLWNDKMQNAKIFMGVFSSIQNAKFFMGWVRTFWLFDFF
jgi:hypothetical protein